MATSKWIPQPGDVVSASRGLYSHVGIVSDVTVGGRSTVISASKQMGHAIEETWAEFAAGAPVRFRGYPGQLPRTTVVARARAQIGRRWKLLDNCEHLVTRAHGLPPQSPQLGAGVAVAVLVAATCLAGEER